MKHKLQRIGSVNETWLEAVLPTENTLREIEVRACSALLSQGVGGSFCQTLEAFFSIHPKACNLFP